jgi:hypothetical protein
MILKPEGGSSLKPDLRLTLTTRPTMIQILTDGVLFGHGLANKDTKLYRTLVKLRKQGLVRREGYRYYPTRFGWIAYLRSKQYPLSYFFNLKSKVEWAQIFNVLVSDK